MEKRLFALKHTIYLTKSQVCDIALSPMPWDKEERENDEKSENDEEDEFMEDISSKDAPLFRIDPMKMIRNKGEYKKIKQCNSKAELDLLYYFVYT